MINQDDTTWDDLGPRLDDIFKLRAEKVAFVKGDDAVDFGQDSPGRLTSCAGRESRALD